MFCDYCRQLLDFNQHPERYKPLRRPLEGDAQDSITNPQKRARTGTEGIQQDTISGISVQPFELYEGSDANHGSQAVWWKTPIPRHGSQGFFSHSTDSSCEICKLVFSSVSASVLESLLETPQHFQASLAFVYKLNNCDILGNDWHGDVQKSILSISLMVKTQLLPMIKLELSSTYGAFQVAFTPHADEADSITLESSKHVECNGSLNTGSPTSFAFAASWLENCMRFHSTCKSHNDKDHQLPTRLINVGLDSGNPKPHLWLPPRDPCRVPYVTLSHCWGTCQKFVLTEALLETLMREINVEELPKSYQDAIAITRRLGIRYLWIDSLCIIQDSVADWRAESAIMGEIYKNSFFTIAASWASNDEEGCFADRDPLHTRFRTSRIRNLDFFGLHYGGPLQCGKEPISRIRARIADLKTKASLGKVGNVERQLLSDAQLKLRFLLRQRNAQDPSTSASSQYFQKILQRNLKTGYGIPDWAVTRSKSSYRVLAAKDLLGSQRENRWLDPPNHSGESQEIEEDDTQDSWVIVPERPTKEISLDSKSEEVEHQVLYIRAPQQDLWTQLVESSPLNTRAWALQERLLSSRILYYSKSQLFWDCAETRACETYPEPISKRFLIPSDDLALGQDALFQVEHRLNKPQVYRQWMHIIEVYSITFMTKPEDKLVALSGLAREVQTLTKDVYCAGLWEGDLARQLLWKTEELHRNQTCAKYRAPSWSWAATDGRVTFICASPVTLVQDFEVLSVHTVGGDSKRGSLGELEYGSLRVRGLLRTCQLLNQGGHLKLFTANDSEFEDQSEDEMIHDSYAEFFPDSAEPLPKDLLCLPVFCPSQARNLEQNEKVKSQLVAGLVLTPTGEFRDEYKRIGCFQLEGTTSLGAHREQDIRSITIV